MSQATEPDGGDEIGEQMEAVTRMFRRLGELKSQSEQAREEADDLGEFKEYNNPFYSRNMPWDDVRETIIRYAATALAENPDIVDVDEVVDVFEDRDASAREIRQYVGERFDRKAEDLARKQIVDEAYTLKPFQDEIKIYGNGKVILQGRSWDSLRASPRSVAERLAAFERLSLAVVKGIDYSALLNRMSPVQASYGGDHEFTDEHREKRDFSHTSTPINAVKLHKNGSIHVWFDDEEAARQVVDALQEGA
jgi:hypothetical protein